MIGFLTAAKSCCANVTFSRHLCVHPARVLQDLEEVVCFPLLLLEAAEDIIVVHRLYVHSKISTAGPRKKRAFFLLVL